MSRSIKKEIRTCSVEDCNIEIASFNKSGLCTLHWSRRYGNLETTKKKKNEQYWKRRLKSRNSITECGYPLCEEQKRKTCVRTCNWYDNHNRCVRCGVLWEKNISHCPHCKYKLRVKPKNNRSRRINNPLNYVYL